MSASAAVLPPEETFEHLVHLYAEDGTLARCVTAFLAPGLLRDEPAVVVATPEHRALLCGALRAAGFDVDALARAGRLVCLDAEQTLAGFFSDGQVDPAAFDREVGSLVQRLATRFGPVHVYGEMVACLWGRGDSAAAVVLEEAWNRLGATADFRLCCAYPLAAIGSGCDADVERMFDTHSDVTAV